MEFRYKTPADARICGGAYGEDCAFLLISTGMPGPDETKVCLRFTPDQGAVLAEQLNRALTEAKEEADRSAARQAALQTRSAA